AARIMEGALADWRGTYAGRTAHQSEVLQPARAVWSGRSKDGGTARRGFGGGSGERLAESAGDRCGFGECLRCTESLHVWRRRLSDGDGACCESLARGGMAGKVHRYLWN